ncbi:hypothetical protein DPEC_G00368220 [Dallia pectoralis]|nr:hypothetical protein DPEC_G00368220 [Dallia pectoralis]
MAPGGVALWTSYRPSLHLRACFNNWECLLNTDPSIAHLLDHSLSRSDFEFNGQYYLQRYVAQQTVSKRIKRTPEGIDRTGVQLAGGYLFQPPSPPIISAVRK